MKNSKLIGVLSIFDAKEWAAVTDFLFYKLSQNDKYVRFLDFLSINYPSFEEENITKKKAFNYVFKKGTYKDVKIRELMSVVYKEIENYFIYVETTNSTFNSQYNLLRQFRKRKLGKQFEKQLNVLLEHQKDDVLRNKEYYRRSFLIASEQFKHFDAQQLRLFEHSLQTEIDSLDLYYFSLKLRKSCEIIAREHWMNQQYDLKLIDAIIDIAQHNNYLQVPSIICYVELLNLLRSDSDIEQYYKTTATLKAHLDAFDLSEKRYIYNLCLNYCIQELNKGNKAFESILFDLQKFLLADKILLENNQLSHISYRNIVSVALKQKEYDWCKNFIEEYKELIVENYRENAFNLAQATYLYEQKKHSETIVILNQVTFTDSYYACSAKFILLKAYYELKEWDTLEYFVIAFKLFLKRNKEISSTYKNSSQNFLKLFKKVVALSTKQDFMEKSKVISKKKALTKMITVEKELANRDWLLEKLSAVN